MNLCCERCHRRMRSTFTFLGSEFVQDFYHDGKRTVRVAEIDDSMCEDCEARFIADCEAYRETQETP